VERPVAQPVAPDPAERLDIAGLGHDAGHPSIHLCADQSGELILQLGPGEALRGVQVDERQPIDDRPHQPPRGAPELGPVAVPVLVDEQVQVGEMDDGRDVGHDASLPGSYCVEYCR
jgi:hypothetical protein